MVPPSRNIPSDVHTPVTGSFMAHYDFSGSVHVSPAAFLLRWVPTDQTATFSAMHLNFVWAYTQTLVLDTAQQCTLAIEIAFGHSLWLIMILQGVARGWTDSHLLQCTMEPAPAWRDPSRPTGGTPAWSPGHGLQQSPPLSVMDPLSAVAGHGADLWLIMIFQEEETVGIYEWTAEFWDTDTIVFGGIQCRRRVCPVHTTPNVNRQPGCQPVGQTFSQIYCSLCSCKGEGTCEFMKHYDASAELNRPIYKL